MTKGTVYDSVASNIEPATVVTILINVLQFSCECITTTVFRHNVGQRYFD